MDCMRYDYRRCVSLSPREEDYDSPWMLTGNAVTHTLNVVSHFGNRPFNLNLKRKVQYFKELANFVATHKFLRQLGLYYRGNYTALDLAKGQNLIEALQQNTFCQEEKRIFVEIDLSNSENFMVYYICAFLRKNSTSITCLELYPASICRAPTTERAVRESWQKPN